MYTLSRRAASDLRHISNWLLENDGPIAADRVLEILRDCMLKIGSGLITGHRRTGFSVRRSLLFVTAEPSKYVIAFDPESRLIVRIVHGARDLPRVLKAD